MNARLDPPRARFRIHNRLTGRYLCSADDTIRYFSTRFDALCCIKLLHLNRDLFETEAVL